MLYQHALGYAESFFKPIAEKLPRYGTSGAVESKRDFSANAAVEPLLPHGAFAKKPLQRIVQLLKRDRDQYYDSKAINRPSSILLTTLTAKSYAAAVGSQWQTLLDFVIHVVSKLQYSIVASATPGGERYSSEPGKFRGKTLQKRGGGAITTRF